jgi:hypothetical protein
MKSSILSIVMAGVFLAGCSMTQPEAAADLNAAFNVAAAGEAAYAAHPGANPKTVAQMGQLLAAAQGALLSWTNAQTPGNQATVDAAIAALVAYEASAKAG